MLIPDIKLSAQSPEFCATYGGPNAIGPIPQAANGNMGDYSGPYYLKVYPHVIRQIDGSGGQTDEAVRKAFERLNADFNPHNIFFVRPCEVIDIPVSNEAYFNFNIYCNLWQNPAFQHADGIDLFFGPEEITNNAGGLAMDIPSKALWVGGTWPLGTGAPWNVIESPILSHEMGHCLGLWHTHHGTITEVLLDCSGNITEIEQCCELVNGSNSNTCGDYVQDTPADPRYWYQFQPQPCANLIGWFSIGSSDCFTKDPATNARLDEK